MWAVLFGCFNPPDPQENIQNSDQFSIEIKCRVCQIQSILQILPIPLDVQKLKSFQLQGASPSWLPDQMLCPWNLLGALRRPQIPVIGSRYHARHGPLHSYIASNAPGVQWNVLGRKRPGEELIVGETSKGRNILLPTRCSIWHLFNRL